MAITFKHTVSPLLIFVVLWSLQTQAATNNPFKDFLSAKPYALDDTILSFSLQFDSGAKYLFVANSSLVDGKAGYVWQPYKINGTEFEPTEDEYSFRSDTLTFTSIPNSNEKWLITYLPQNAERGVLTGIHEKSGKLEQEVLGEIEPQLKNQELYDSYFSTNEISIEARPVSEILSNLPAQSQPQNQSSLQRVNSDVEALDPKAPDSIQQAHGLPRNVIEDRSRRTLLMLIVVALIVTFYVMKKLRKSRLE